MLIVLALCVVWGLQPVAVKVIGGDVAPAMQLAIRFSCAAVFFGAWLLIREGPGALADGTLRSGLALGAMFSLEFVLLGEALAHTTATHAIVFLYSSPIFTALGLQFLPDERLRRLQWTGIAVAFIGIAIAFIGPASRSVKDVVIGDFLALCAGASWGLTNVVLRRGRVGDATTIKTVFYQVTAAAVVLLIFAAETGQSRIVFSSTAILSLVFQTLIIAIGSYLVWFWLLRHYLTSRLMMLSLLTPLCGVLFGAALLGDPIDPRFAVGSLLVLAGILVVNARQLLQRSA